MWNPSRILIFMLCIGVSLAHGSSDQAYTPVDPNPAPAREKPSPVLGDWIPGPGPLVTRHPTSIVKAHAPAANIEDAIDLCVTQNMDILGTPGASVSVVLEGAVIYQQGYGVKHRTNGGDVDANTIFRIGSVTKQLTAAAVMQQVEAGTVFLDDPVTRYIPELEIDGLIPADRITVHHLLSHTSGYPDIGFNPAGPTGDEALSDWAADQADIILHAPPGVFYNYSNPNFNLAGLVVERASGTSYRDYMHGQVFGPAGMTRTTFDPSVVMADGNYTYGHYDLGSGIERIYPPDDYDNWVYGPAGYAFSTAGDLTNWALTLIDGGGAVLSPTSAEMMQTPYMSLELLPGQSYGYGIFIEPFEELTIWQHGGNIWGWGTFMIWEPERRFAVAVLANTFQSLAGAAYCITDAVLEPAPGPPIDDPSDPSTWDRFEGAYDLPYQEGLLLRGEVVLLDEEELALLIWYPDNPFSEIFELSHVGFDIFLADFDGDDVPESDVKFIERGRPAQASFLRARIIAGVGLHAPLDAGGNQP